MSDSSDDDDLPDLESVDSSEVRERERVIDYRGSINLSSESILDIVFRSVTWLASIVFVREMRVI